MSPSNTDSTNPSKRSRNKRPRKGKAPKASASNIISSFSNFSTDMQRVFNKRPHQQNINANSFTSSQNRGQPTRTILNDSSQNRSIFIRNPNVLEGGQSSQNIERQDRNG